MTDRGSAQVHTSQEELKAEVLLLREQVRKLESQREVVKATGSWLGRLGVWFFFGPRMVSAARTYLRTVKASGELLPELETAQLAGAVVRRLVRVGAVGLVISSLAVCIPLWQTYEIRRQTTQFGEEDRLTRRAQLLQILYECDPSAEAGTSAPVRCDPVAPLRARQEAAMAFVALEKQRGLARPDLSGVNLTAPRNGQEVTLFNADFSDVDLNGSSLSGSVLPSSDFHGASLFGANLRFVDFNNANLTEADLTEANLTRANLAGASLVNADVIDARLKDVFLANTDLSGANLEGATDLSQSALDEAIGSVETMLPMDLKPPEHWRLTKQEQEAHLDAVWDSNATDEFGPY